MSMKSGGPGVTINDGGRAPRPAIGFPVRSVNRTFSDPQGARPRIVAGPSFADAPERATVAPSWRTGSRT